MIELSDIALIVRADPFKENDALISAFTQQHGLVHGVAKFGMTSKQRGTYCIGNTVELTWSARLEEHLGNIKAELIAPSGTMVMAHRDRCYALQSMAALVTMAFETRDSHPLMFRGLEQLMEALRFGLPWQADYARFEALLLRETGYGLSLESCIACGALAALRYVSPKSGCAVCADDGAPYAGKLFDYPAMLMAEMHTRADAQEVLAALEITGHFVQNWLLAAHDKSLPAARGRLMSALAKMLAEIA